MSPAEWLLFARWGWWRLAGALLLAYAAALLLCTLLSELPHG